MAKISSCIRQITITKIPIEIALFLSATWNPENGLACSLCAVSRFNYFLSIHQPNYQFPIGMIVPTCVPPNGNHLEIELDQLPVGKNRFLLGTQARFSCKNENVFVLSGGASVAHCNEDGKFNHNPKCGRYTYSLHKD